MTSIPDQSRVFKRVRDHDWEQNTEFQSGLRTILQSANPDQHENLTSRAKCFYFRRITQTPIDHAEYQKWLASNQTTEECNDPEGRDKPEIALDADNLRRSGGSEEDAPYPKSFAEVIELITSGKPVPGIKEIPDVILEAPKDAVTLPQRKKPWELNMTIQG